MAVRRAGTGPAAPPPPRGGRAGWLPLVACCLGTFLLLLYTAIVTVALPGIGSGLGAGFGARQWIVDGYAVALAGLLLGAGAVGDEYGSRRVYLAGLTGFTLATLACGLAVSPGWLIAARVAQGAAGAAMFATILALIGLTYPEPGRRATAFAIWGAVAGAASAVGTVGGGVLSEYAGWRWLFLGTLPLCALALASATRCLPRHRAPRPRSRRAGRPRVDWPGIVLATVAVSALAYAVIDAGEAGWAAPGPVAGWAVAGGAGAGLVAVERGRRDPVLPPALIGTPRFVAVLLVAFGYYFASFGALPALATWLQTGLGLTSLTTALVLVVQLVVFVAVSGLASRHLHRRHPAWTLGAATILVGLGALTGTALAAWPRWPALLPFLVLSGAGAGVVSPVLPALAIASAPARHAGVASSAANAVRQLGLALGVAVCGTLAGRSPTGTGASLALVACAAAAVGAGGLACVLMTRGTATGAGYRTTPAPAIASSYTRSTDCTTSGQS